MDRLKPCPFCGGEAECYRTVVKVGLHYSDAVFVRCTSCEARTGNVLFDGRKHPNDEEYTEAEQAWNNRVPETVVNQFGENCTHISNCGTLNLNL